MYGFYPELERWRINFAFILLAAAAGPLLTTPLLPESGRFKTVLPILFAVAGIGLSLVLFGILPACVAAAYLIAPVLLSRISRTDTLPGSGFTSVRFVMVTGITAAAYVVATLVASSMGFGLSGAVAFIAASLTLLLLTLKNGSTQAWRFFMLLTIYPAIATICFLGGGFGLPPVETDQWGGLFLTLVIAGIGMAASFPIGILLALGRRSHMPIIRNLCIGFIELIRGVPLISVLFMVSIMLPMTLPEGVHINKLLRALVAVSLFYAAYMAEVIRGGLQAIPKGQYEAAEALGLHYWKSMRLVIMPQALRLVIPGMTNTILGLAKDTTLVAVINLMDLLGILKSALADTNWLGFTKEAYIFAGLTFWVLCFGISRYSMRLEKRLRVEKH
jgi:general L-amino acid transport system permease protein